MPAIPPLELERVIGPTFNLQFNSILEFTGKQSIARASERQEEPKIHTSNQRTISTSKPAMVCSTLTLNQLTVPAPSLQRQDGRGLPLRKTSHCNYAIGFEELIFKGLRKAGF
jgi:hypothetical protein